MKALFPTDDCWGRFHSAAHARARHVSSWRAKAARLVWYGGFGFEGTMGAYTQKIGMPSVIAFLVIIGELFGSLALLAGLLTRFTAASLAVIMLGAVTIVHLPHGFS